MGDFLEEKTNNKIDVKNISPNSLPNSIVFIFIGCVP